MTTTKHTIPDPAVEVHEALTMSGLSDLPTREQLDAVRHADGLFATVEDRDARILNYLHLFAYGMTVVSGSTVTMTELVKAHRRTKPLGLIPRLLHQGVAARDAFGWAAAIFVWLVAWRWLAGVGGLLASSAAIAVAVYGPTFFVLSFYDVTVDWAGGDSTVRVERR